MKFITVDLIYPAGFNLEKKQLELNDLELTALLNSKKVGSEGKYFLIEELIFEDYKESTSLTVMLKTS